MAAIAALGMNAGQFNNEVTYTKRGTTFALVAQKAQSVNLNIYAEGTGGKPVKTVAMRKGEKGVWKAEVKGDLKGRFYTFNVKQDGKMLGETPGLFAKAVGVNGKRGAIIDMAATNPEGWESDRALGYAPPTLSCMNHITAISRSAVRKHAIPASFWRSPSLGLSST